MKRTVYIVIWLAVTSAVALWVSPGSDPFSRELTAEELETTCGGTCYVVDLPPCPADTCGMWECNGPGPCPIEDAVYKKHEFYQSVVEAEYGHQGIEVLDGKYCSVDHACEDDCVYIQSQGIYICKKSYEIGDDNWVEQEQPDLASPDCDSTTDTRMPGGSEYLVKVLKANGSDFNPFS